MNLVPDYIFNAFDEASADFLESIGVKSVILDIDNTLEPYENPTPGERVITWLDSLKAKGINTAIVSNNNWKRVNLFNKDLGMPAIAWGKKPFKVNVVRAMNMISAEKKSTVFIGDQILTDVLAAHNAGIRAILVYPIKDKQGFFTRFKRLIERPFIKKYEKRANK